MSIYLDIFDEHEILSEEEANGLHGLLQHAAKHLKYEEDAEVSIAIISNSEIQSYNNQYRGKDCPTDVLSFALLEMGEDEEEYETEVEELALGDILISYEKAREQAEEYGHSFERELGFLAVHGFLHLLGYDHMTEEEEEVMTKRQKEILDAYGLTRS